MTQAGETSVTPGHLPQAYIKKVLFEIPKAQMDQMRREDGFGSKPEELKHLDYVLFQMDGQENAYVLFTKAVRIFSKDGKLLGKVKLAEKNAFSPNEIYVDGNGDFCVYRPGLLGTNPYIYFRKYDYRNPEMVKGVAHQFVSFLNGDLYSPEDGRVLYSANGKNETDQKIFFNTLVHGRGGWFKKGPQTGKNIPENIDDYLLHGPRAVDLAGNFYFEAKKPIGTDGLDEDGRAVVLEDRRIYKFDKNFNLLASVPTGFTVLNNGFINLKSGNIYGVEITKDAYRFVRWEIAN